MNTGILERIRIREADIENHIDSIVQQMLLQEEVKNDRHQLLIQHFIAGKLRDITRIADELADSYLDDDDIVNARNAPSSGREVLAMALKEFDAKAADIREYRAAMASIALPPIRHELSRPQPRDLDSIFAVPEHYGRCLYLEENYQLYVRFMRETMELGRRSEEDLPGDPVTASSSARLRDEIQSWSASWEDVDEYIPFVAQLSPFILNVLPAQRKLAGFEFYRAWVENLLCYLEDFYRRIFPLEEERVVDLLQDINRKSEEYWAALSQVEEIPWANAASVNTKKLSGLVVPSSIRHHLEQFSLWPIPFVRSLLAEGMSNTSDWTLQYFPKSLEEVRGVCVTEARIVALLESLLHETYQYTVKYMKRSQSKTLEELETEREEEELAYAESLKSVQKHALNTVEGTIAQAAQYHLQAEQAAAAERELQGGGKPKEEEDEEEDRNVVLDDDGKPIPRWLAQYQQLNKIFTCEICGGTIYRGPKVFREHFGQERHAKGLWQVGVVQHLKSYEGLTSIREVINMRDRLNRTLQGTRKRLREERNLEEMQDEKGRVVTEGGYEKYQQRQQMYRSMQPSGRN